MIGFRSRQHGRTSARARIAVLALGLLALAAFQPDMGRAAGTDPLLAVDQVRTFTSASGARTVEISAIYSFEDLLQFPFPAGLIVTRGPHWVRYGLDGTIAQGTNLAVANGVTPAEVETLLASGSTAAAPAAVVRITPAGIAVTLPATIAPGSGRVLVYVQLEDETFVSNSLAVSIP